MRRTNERAYELRGRREEGRDVRGRNQSTRENRMRRWSLPVIGVLAIYICIHQPSVDAEQSLERILVRDECLRTFSLSLALFFSFLHLLLFRLYDPRFLFFNFFLVLPWEVHQSRTSGTQCDAIRARIISKFGRRCTSFSRFGASFNIMRASLLFLESNGEYKDRTAEVSSCESPGGTLVRWNYRVYRHYHVDFARNTLINERCRIIYSMYTSIINYAMYYKLLLLKLHWSGSLEENSSSKSTKNNKIYFEFHK